MSFRKAAIISAALMCGALLISPSQAAPVTLGKLAGLTGDPGAPGTAVYKAELTSFGPIASITIADNSSGLGGATGQFSGFDLDGIKLSTVNCADAACASGAAALAVFDFAGSGTVFTPGIQRAPTDPRLFGTTLSGSSVDNAVATLQSFDAVNSTATPAGFISLGDNGSLAFNLTALVDPASYGSLYLYIGEVGDNGEVVASNIQVRNTRLPEPASLGLLGLAFVGLAVARRRQRPAGR
ncbi:MAG: PEP-CTERM sorting domain-containing protein [Candidatus Accumulibacter sp.]|nr:PEP-CTERM sorting domain-containing protein [Accumulibacter sp.]